MLRDGMHVLRHWKFVVSMSLLYSSYMYLRIVVDAQRFAVKGTYCEERSYNCTEISNAGCYTCILLPYLNNRN